MKTLQFDSNDTMPILGLGTWKSGPGEVYAAVKEALRIGYRHLDCAAIYGNEAEIGAALKESFAAGVVRRDQVWITSKLWNDSHAAADVQPALEKTLSDLTLEYLDLYLIHWPVALKKGLSGRPVQASDMYPLSEIPLLETWTAMEKLFDRGLTKHIGVSNFSIAKLEGLLNGGQRKPEVNQIELHPYLQQNEMLAFCRKNDIHLTAYSPLGSPDRPEGMKAVAEPNLLEEPVVLEIADECGTTAAAVLLSWAVHRDTAVIPKSVNPQRMAQNFAAASLPLTTNQMQRIAALDRHRRYVDGSFWEIEGSGYTVANLWDE